MVKKRSDSLALVMLMAFVMVVVLLDMASASTPGNISTCQELNESGTYYLNRSLNGSDVVSINCFNISANDIILNCDGKSLDFNGAESFLFNSSNTNNFTFINCNGSFNFFYFINVSNFNFINNTFYGGIIYSINSSNFNIDNNIYLLGWLFFENSSNNKILNNSFFNSGGGNSGSVINLTLSNNNSIINNIINDTDLSISLHYSFNNSIIRNNISWSGNAGIYLENSSENNIINNSLYYSDNFDLFLISSNNNNVSFNFMENTVDADHSGLVMSSSHNNYFNSNHLLNIPLGVYIVGSKNNTLRNNNISNATYTVFFMANENLEMVNDIDRSNIFNNKYLYYNYSISDVVFDSFNSNDSGGFFCGMCNNITIKDLNLSNNGNAIYFFNVTNSSITNISSYDNNYGILIFYSDNINISRNYILRNNDGLGLYYSYNNIVDSNVIINSSSSGIELYYCRNNTLINNNLSGSYRNFNIYGLENQDFNNRIDTTNLIENQFRIYSNYSIANYIFDNNTSPNPGVFYFANCTNITIKNNKIIDTNANSISLFNVTNSSIINMTIINSSYGIYFQMSKSLNISSNFISSSAIDLYGFNFSYNIISKNNLSESTYAVWLLEGINNLIYDNTFDSTISYGLNLHNISYSEISNNYFENLLLPIEVRNNFYNYFYNNSINNTRGSYSGSIYIYNSNSLEFHNQLIENSSIGGDIELSLSNNISFINSTYNISKEYVGSNSNLSRKWYYKAYTSSSNGSALGDVTITATDVRGNSEFSRLTQSNGYSYLLSLTDYVNNGTHRIYFSNYTIVASRSSFNGSNHTFNSSLTRNKYNDLFSLTYSPATTPPSTGGDTSGGGGGGSSVNISVTTPNTTSSGTTPGTFSGININSSSVTLTWNININQVKNYEIRYCTTQITEANWNTCLSTGFIEPTRSSYVINGLNPDNNYYFGIKALYNNYSYSSILKYFTTKTDAVLQINQSQNSSVENQNSNAKTNNILIYFSILFCAVLFSVVLFFILRYYETTKNEDLNVFSNSSKFDKVYFESSPTAPRLAPSENIEIKQDLPEKKITETILNEPLKKLAPIKKKDVVIPKLDIVENNPIVAKKPVQDIKVESRTNRIIGQIRNKLKLPYNKQINSNPSLNKQINSLKKESPYVTKDNIAIEFVKNK
ncbi:MAG: right-handed parallel beta-helix repeat-containing protein [Candidatus Pacearchaeota archaeon]|jgi:parallel beta-helix repeat protein